VAALDGADVARRLAAAEPVKIVVGGTEEELRADDLLVETRQREGFAVQDEAGLVVGLLTTLTPELQREGLARELVHHVQNTRKAAGFRIEDRISLAIDGPDAVVAMLAEFCEWVKRETLSTDVVVSQSPEADAALLVQAGAYTEEVSVNGLPVRISVTRVAVISE
jgi:isoleucyl-tRNA synthetase